MYFPRFCLLFFLIFNFQVWAQQSPPSANQPSPPGPPQLSHQVPPLPPAIKDATAMNVVSQALTAAGAPQAFTSIKDYTATGNITKYAYLPGNAAAQGTVTVRGLGLHLFRMDTILPPGDRSEVINGIWKVKNEKGVVGTIPQLYPLSPTRLVVPYMQLWVAAHSKHLNLVYKGIVQVDGKPEHDVEVQRLFSGSNLTDPHIAALNIDFFIDPSTFQVVMMQDFVFQNEVRQIRYSNLTLSNGVLVPYTISETILGQPVWLIQLSQVTFNSGLQPSDFQL